MNIPKEVESIINQSGNNFHCRVLNEFRSKGWETLVSPYYMDAVNNKPREIDLLVEKAYKFSDHMLDIYGTLNVKLFIECKYIKQGVVFWFDKKDIEATKHWLLQHTSFRENNVFINEHSYLMKNEMVAKLYKSNNKPNLEYDPIYKALNQCLHSIVYMRTKRSIIRSTNKRFDNLLELLSLPVIVFNDFDDFYRIDMNDQATPQKISDNFQLEVNYAYIDTSGNSRNKYFLIDVIDFNRLDSYLETIDSDIEALKKVIQ